MKLQLDIKSTFFSVIERYGHYFNIVVRMSECHLARDGSENIQIDYLIILLIQMRRSRIATPYFRRTFPKSSEYSFGASHG
jgi:hypothetical protein